MIRARHGGAVALGAAVLLTLASATSAGAAIAPPGTGGYEFPNSAEADVVNRDIPSSMSAARVPSSHVPRPTSLSVSTTSGATSTIPGLTLKDQRTADGGNQFSLEPPDQALCVGGGNVVEAVNDVFRIHTSSGVSEATSLTKFFTGQSQIIRPTATTPVQYGPFLSDPKCYFDPGSQRFFMTMLEIDQNSVTGAFGPRTATYIAVSKSSTPSTNSADWYLYTIDTTNDGTADQSGVGIPSTPWSTVALPSHPGCPCLGDQPLIGADQYGFYVTTNEFSLDGPEFNGAQVYALDKAGLENGTFRMQAIYGSPIALAEGPAYSLQPATSPTPADWSGANGGTEYFLSALDFNATLDSRIAEWRLTNTSTLPNSLPGAPLTVKLETPNVISSEVYGQPPAVVQKSGPTPLADLLKERENLLNSNDDRMNQVVFQGGKLWGAVNTVVKTSNGPTQTGIAWFAVKATTNAAKGTMANQGYVAVNNQSVFFPSIAMNSDGKGVMTFSLSGKDYYPSSAYVHISASGTSGPVHIMGGGAAPADGFTGYQAYGGSGVERWGDYSAAVPGGDGSIWVAAEDIPGTFGWVTTENQYLANWGTTIAQVTP